MKASKFVIAVLATAPISVLASGQPNWVETGFSHEHLSNGMAIWDSGYVSGQYTTSGDRVVFGGVRTTNRYELSDREAHLGASIPLSPLMRLEFDAGVSNTHRILPQHYQALAASYRVGSNWVVTAGLRQSQYDSGATQVYHINLEHYVGTERFAYTGYQGGPASGRLSASHRLEWNHYFSDLSWAGISIANGHETENMGTSGLLTSHIQNVAVVGQAPLSRAWHLTWETGSFRQGERYTRNGIRLGLRHVF